MGGFVLGRTVGIALGAPSISSSQHAYGPSLGNVMTGPNCLVAVGAVFLFFGKATSKGPARAGRRRERAMRQQMVFMLVIIAIGSRVYKLN
jgi:hypothetical protein